MFVDTHLHIIDKSQLSYPWLAGVPALNRDFPYAEYERQARRAGISDVLHMEVDVDAARDGARDRVRPGYREEAGQPDPRRHRRLPAGRSEGFAAYLERQLQNPFVKGFRRVLHVMPDELSESPLFRDNIRRLNGTRPELRSRRPAAPDPARRSRSPTLRPICGSSSTTAACRISRRMRSSVAGAHRRHRQASQRHRQDFRHRRLCRQRQLVRRDAPPLCRARHRQFRLGPRRLGQRLAGLHAGRRAAGLDSGDARHPCRLQQRRARKTVVAERRPALGSWDWPPGLEPGSRERFPGAKTAERHTKRLCGGRSSQLLVVAAWPRSPSMAGSRPRGRRNAVLGLGRSDTRRSSTAAIAPLLAQNPGKTGLRLLTDNIEAFALRAAASRHAQRSLDLQYYYWKDDLTGGLLANEVIKAADRGVRVRLLLDDINSWGRDSNYRALDKHPNVEVRLFNPIRCREGALLRGIEMLAALLERQPAHAQQGLDRRRTAGLRRRPQHRRRLFRRVARLEFPRHGSAPPRPRGPARPK